MAPRRVILYKARQAQAISRPTAAATSGRSSCKQIFAKLRFSFTGDFGSGWGYDKMAGWVRHHGGEYEKEVQCGQEALLRQRYTTHLICTIEEYKKKSSQVKKALSLGKYCNIVVGDWLADCLVPNNSKKRRRVEKGYTLNRVLRRVDKTRKAQERYRESFEDGVRAGHELVDNRLHHITMDVDGFEYKVVLSRINTDGKVKLEKYTIYLFASNAKPRHYMFGGKLNSPGRKAVYYRLECHPKVLQEAFKDFKNFFKLKTGVEWDNRLEPLTSEQLANPHLFRYTPPTHGRPVGQLPEGVRPPWERPGASNQDDSDADSAIAMGSTSSSDVSATVSGSGEGADLVYDSESEVEDAFDKEDSD